MEKHKMAKKFLVEITTTNYHDSSYLENLEESDDIEKIRVIKTLNE